MENVALTPERLTKLLENVDSGRDEEGALLGLTIDRIGDSDPEFAHLVRLCAIPRRLDRRVIGVLREAPEDEDENDMLLSRIAGFSFVNDRQAGGLTFHDDVRDHLLERWLSNPESRRELDAVNERLATMYAEEREFARTLERDLDFVGRTIQKVSRRRFVQLGGIVERLVVDPMLEAFYHDAMRSPVAGYDRFVECFEDCESEGRYSICQTLVVNARIRLAELAKTDASAVHFLKWLDYWRARAALQVRRLDEAIALLEALLRDTEIMPRLRLWVLMDLGSALAQQFEMRAAEKALDDALELAEHDRVDDWNLAAVYAHRGALDHSLGRLDRAAQGFVEALRLARSHENRGAEMHVGLQLGGVLLEMGRFDDALDTALEALQLVRASQPTEAGASRAVAELFMSLFAARDAALLETVVREAHSLLPDRVDPFVRFRLENLTLDLLRTSGHLSTARSRLEKVRKAAATSDDPVAATETLFTEGLVLEDLGRPGDAASCYARVANATSDGTSSTDWRRAMALLNLGGCHTGLGEWEEGRSCLEEARLAWARLGHTAMVAAADISTADLERRMGRFEQAEAQLAAIEPHQNELGTDVRVRLHEVAGDLARDRADWDDAVEHYGAALRGCSAAGWRVRAARAAERVAESAGQCGDFDRAAATASVSTETWRELVAIEAFETTPQRRHGDSRNASALRCIHFGGEGDSGNLEQARDYLHAAVKSVPDNFWYRLNLAYAGAQANDWEEAATAFEAAIDVAPPWLRAPALDKQLAEFSVKAGRALFEAGLYGPAVTRCTAVIDRLGRRMPPAYAARARLTLGDSLLSLGRFADAERAYRSALLDVATDPEAPGPAPVRARLALVAAVQADAARADEELGAMLDLEGPAPLEQILEDPSGLVARLAETVDSEPGLRALQNGVQIVSERLEQGRGEE